MTSGTMSDVTASLHDTRTPPAAPRRRQGRAARVAALGAAVLMVLSLSGCLRLNAQMQVRKDDTVSGRILVAGDGTSQVPELDRLSPPTGLEQKVRITPYSADGFTGKEIYFTQLTFAEVDSLSLALDVDGSRPYTLGFRRGGDAVTFTGAVDLTSVPADLASTATTRVDLTFPNEVAETNGQRGSGNSVSWQPKPGSVTRMEATSHYPDPAARGFAVWMIVGVGAALLVSIGVVLAARRARARSDKLIR